MGKKETGEFYRAEKGPDPPGDGPTINSFADWLKKKGVKVDYKDIKHVKIDFKNDRAKLYFKTHKKIIIEYEKNKDVIDNYISGKVKRSRQNSRHIDLYEKNRDVVTEYKDRYEKDKFFYEVYPYKLRYGEERFTDEYKTKVKGKTRATIKTRDKKEKREDIIDQAITLIDDAYVHLPLKRAMHAVDPVQRLKLLKYRNSRLDDKTFHSEMISIFNELRDLHTVYILPDDFNTKIAFLPFLIEEFYDLKEKKKKYMVSKKFEWANETKLKSLGANITNPHRIEYSIEKFQRGVIVTHWNGLPIAEAIRLNGERNAGSNECARYARGLERLTIRPLTTALPPEEKYVNITYKEEGGEHYYHIRLTWYIADYKKKKKKWEAKIEDRSERASLGIDIEAEIARLTKKELFFQEKRKEESKDNHLLTGLTRDDYESHDVFAYGKTEYKGKKYGYVRIYTFNAENSDAFVDKFIEIIEKLPKDGLIIDVRGNGGGIITAGEKLLSVLGKLSPNVVDRDIEYERFQFINSPLTHMICKNSPTEFGLGRWVKSIKSSVETGAVYSQGFTLTTWAAASKQKYTKKLKWKYKDGIVLITDALCYSTTDIFAAGFKDNNIGTILGVHGKTGAGGADVWCYSDLMEFADKQFKKLPDGVDFRVAVRRATRIGEKTGMPLEDIGVESDTLHEMTKNDLENQNEDLIRKAAAILADEIIPGKQKEDAGG